MGNEWRDVMNLYIVTVLRAFGVYFMGVKEKSTVLPLRSKMLA